MQDQIALDEIEAGVVTRHKRGTIRIDGPCRTLLALAPRLLPLRVLFRVKRKAGGFKLARDAIRPALLDVPAADTERARRALLAVEPSMFVIPQQCMPLTTLLRA